VEDSGPAAAGLGFGLALGGLLYVSLSAQTWKSEAAAGPAREELPELTTQPMTEGK
jgi:hypothetical protein